MANLFPHDPSQTETICGLTVSKRALTATKYRIEARDNPAEAWDTDLGQGNEFDTEAEAQAMIEELRDLGDEWATAEYRIVANI